MRDKADIRAVLGSRLTFKMMQACLVENINGI